MRLIKSHALGNDFLLMASDQLPSGTDRAALARAVCARHRGIGADGLIVYTPTSTGASMELLNADGSYSEVSGNGVRCLAAWIASRDDGRTQQIEIATDAGIKRLTLLERSGPRYTFRAHMGEPDSIARVSLDAVGQRVDAVTLRVGNPQCVVLGDATETRLHSIARALAIHPHFQQGTNVELAEVQSSDLVRILIWERGVGPTEASGTGACAAAVAAHRYGGASADVRVTSPGGTQRVEWLADGLYLTGWAELVAEVTWFGNSG
jgi:diaminopimelate epimerase